MDWFSGKVSCLCGWISSQFQWASETMDGVSLIMYTHINISIFLRMCWLSNNVLTLLLEWVFCNSIFGENKKTHTRTSHSPFLSLLLSVIWLPWRSTFLDRFRQEEVDIITRELVLCSFPVHARITPSGARPRRALLGNMCCIFTQHTHVHAYAVCNEAAK